MRTATQYERFAAQNLTRPGGKGPWATPANSYCVEAVWFFGGFSRSFDNATMAAGYVSQRHGLDPDYASAGPGEFHYYGTGAGHITMESALRPGYALMVSGFANSLAQGLGYLTGPQYGLPTGHGHTYLGHSPYFGDETLATEVDPSGGGVTPVPDIPFTYQGRKMNIVYEELNAAGNHYVAHLIAEDGTIVDSIDNQEGWAGPPAVWTPSPDYVTCVQVFDPREANINPVLSVAQMTRLKARIASNWVKPATGGTMDLTHVVNLLVALATSLGADTAAIEAATAATPAATVKAEATALGNG